MEEGRGGRSNDGGDYERLMHYHDYEGELKERFMHNDDYEGMHNEMLTHNDDYEGELNERLMHNDECGNANSSLMTIRKALIKGSLSGSSCSVANNTSQIAIIGAKFSPIESLDYEIVENTLFKQDWRTQTQLQIFQYVILKWMLALLVGLITGVTAFIINLAVENIAGAKLLKTINYMEQGRNIMAITLFFGSNMLLVVSSAFLCSYVGPSAAGSGIPEVKAYLNGIDAPHILAPQTLLVKILGSIGGVAGGLYVGKEGPLVHIGACFALLLSQGGSSRYNLTWKWLRYFKNDRDRRDLVTCGSAAGVASAFRAPVGGVLFALEEAASWWWSSLLWRSFFTTAVVAVVLRYLINFCHTGKCGIYGSGGLIMFDIGDTVTDFSLNDLLPAIALGIIGGILGSFFTLINGKVVRTYSYYYNKHGPFAKLFQAALLSLITSSCIFGLPWLASCTACPSNLTDSECPSNDGTRNFQQFGCPAGHYNDLASLLFNTKDNVIRNLFSTNKSNEFQAASIMIFLLTSFLLTLITYGSALPSGLFIPVIITGAAYGRLAGMILHSLGGNRKLNEGVYAVLGSASFLGGSMRMTVSLCVILLELTNSLTMLPLVMLVLLLSKSIGDLFNHSIYDQIVRIKCLPFLEENPEPYMKHLSAQDVCSAPLVTLYGVERVATIVEALKSTNHNGFPVIDKPVMCNNTLLVGIILRSHLLVILKKKLFLPSQDTASDDYTKGLTSVDFTKPGSGKGPQIEDIDLTEQERNMFVDLHPFTNTSPYTIVDTMSLAKAYSLFRKLGLRHLCVVPTSRKSQPIFGLLTRHDFMPEHVLSLYPHLKHNRWKRLRVRPSIIIWAAEWSRFWRSNKL